MADQALPEDYDAIILGTGMTECIIAAALSRIGWKVLHLDRYDYYSGDWATFNFEGLLNWIQFNKSEDDDKKLKAKDMNLSELLKEGEKNFALEIDSNNISDIKEFVYISEEEESVKESAEEEVGKGDNEETKETQEGSIQTQDSGDGDSANGACGKEAEAAEDSGADKTETVEKGAEKSVRSKEENPEEKSPEMVKKWTLGEIKKNWRKFNIDLAPRILYCRGPMVELLISSDIAKYCTFRNITRVLTLLNGKLEQVPCSRSDVFGSKQVSMIEKRMLMKLLTFAIEFEKHPEEYSDFSDKPFSDFLKSKKLSANVHHYVHNAIAMATDETTTLEGLESTQKFLQSLGRYGNTAFLWPLYGSGELPQCFCRMCAVFGGIYCLRRTGTQLLVDSDNKCSGIIDTEGQRLNAKCIVMEASFASKEVLPNNTEDQKFISRAILLTDRSILPSDKEQISLLCLPPIHENGSYITIYELSHLSCACPKDIYVVQMSCRGIKDAEVDLRPTVEKLFNSPDSGDAVDEKPRVLWSVFYQQRDTSDVSLPDNAPEGVFVVPSADLALDFDAPIKLAREIFDKLCPGEEFLPKAPNPEDIVFEDGGAGTDQGSGFETNAAAEDNSQSETNAAAEDNSQSETNAAAEDNSQSEENKATVPETENANNTATDEPSENSAESVDDKSKGETGDAKVADS